MSTDTMATIDIPAELFAQLLAKAQAEGKTVDELALDALRESLDKESFTAMTTRLREKYASKVKYTPEQVPDLVREMRQEQRER
jgi:phage-related baseplate assembly protein